jgi:hypothetical protein
VAGETEVYGENLAPTYSDPGSNPDSRCGKLATNRLSHDTTKQSPWPLVRERTIPTELPPLVDEI